MAIQIPANLGDTVKGRLADLNEVIDDDSWDIGDTLLPSAKPARTQTT